jgi:type I restriction enzyme S subunit
MKATELRQSILQAAVQGKLVPQDANDEPASELLKRVQQEKTRLIKKGKIKKEKPLPQITDDEIPYDLPKNWFWCRLSDIVSLYDGSIRRGPFGSAIRKDMFVPFTGFEYKIYEQGNAIRKTVDYGSYYISENHYNKLRSFTVIPGDIIISCSGTLGEAFVIPENAPKGIINQALLKLNINESIMNKRFFLMMFKAIIQQQIVLSSLGSAMKNLTSIVWLKESVVFPLPPLAEQQHIVTKVNELMALCDELEAAEKELETLEDHFVEYLPKSILQAAVQGKLVPQNATDEPATKLLKRIQQEKIQLIKDGKIKKEKPLLPITEDEIPYDLPNGWVWCRLGDVCNLYTGNSINENEKNKKYVEHKDGRCYIGTKDIGFDHIINYENGVKIPFKFDTFREAPKDSILLCIEGGSAGKKIGITDRLICFGNKLCCFIPLVFDSKYLYYYLQSPLLNQLFNQGKAGIIGGVSINMLKKIFIIIPPLAEQQRIVVKLNELIVLCDELKFAREFSYKAVASKIIPFPQQEKDEELLIAARGNASKGLSAKAQRDVDKLFGNGGNE